MSTLFFIFTLPRILFYFSKTFRRDLELRAVRLACREAKTQRSRRLKLKVRRNNWDIPGILFVIFLFLWELTVCFA